MNEDEVPQDRIAAYGGRRKLMYALDRNGAYVAVPSSGWEVEAAATGSELAEIERMASDAWARASEGATSPLEYYMRVRRMDVALLASASGLSRWRVRRHFRTEIYRRLPDRVLARYADALGIDVATLRGLTRCR